MNLGEVVSKERYSKDNQPSDNNLFSKDFNIEKFTPEEREELNYYLEVIFPKLKELIGVDKGDSN